MRAVGCAVDDAAVRIVRIDDDGEVSLGQRVETIAYLDHRMAGERRGARMFGIGRRQHQRAAGFHQRRDARQQDLRAWRRDDIRCDGAP